VANAIDPSLPDCVNLVLDDGSDIVTVSWFALCSVSKINRTDSKRRFLFAATNVICSRFLKHVRYRGSRNHQRVPLFLKLDTLELECRSANVFLQLVCNICRVPGGNLPYRLACRRAHAIQSENDYSAPRIGNCNDILDQFAPIGGMKCQNRA
jgi:hypothetical protein